MLAQQRQQAILERVRSSGGVRVADLVRELGVSDMTIRRDLEVLAERGLLEKVHGGATAAGPGSTEEPGFAAKSARQQPEKEAIARQAARLVRPGTAIALSAGTTTWTLAHFVADVPELTVITNSIRIADVFHRSPRADRTVVLTGGVRTPSDALVGPVAVAAIRGLHVDTLFLGVHGMSARAGFTTPNLLEAETDRELVASAHRLVVPADHTKWDTVGISTIARLSEAHVVISDPGLPQEAREELSAQAGELIIAEPEQDRQVAGR
ncbi:DeoR/GlpR family DNA-binding transcription regulator [Planomonospora parontospora]|uniref:DeoR/GlpR family DNA-binding transcription regulator n=1 Tax=Planomonospora parontospora TaxID=58119 RepID=UPI0016708857|nr:DeoR/GlpR family DNA-binding transcription regulator [Planomonospora parontospora]GGL57567.1 DeoR family transcriptional regulator [Planomonospora parontospora subsp. antibiotica]GII20075.1 DeoR family transcriptional regulator [Planomonospora parontospora subsp. antibiotica]